MAKIILTGHVRPTWYEHTGNYAILTDIVLVRQEATKRDRASRWIVDGFFK